jgi:membrane fusion protein (multidrug efflux system)
MTTPRPKRFRLLTALLLSVALLVGLSATGRALLVWLALGSSEDASAVQAPPLVVATGEIDAEGGILPLSPAQAGIVRATPAREGQMVPKGATLVCLDARQDAGLVAQSRARVATATLRRDQARRAAREHALKVRLAEQAVKEATAQLDAQQVRANWLADLASKNVGSAQESKGASAQLEVFRAALEAQKLRVELVQLERPEETVQLAEIELEASEAALSTALAKQEGATLVAPVDGMVLRVLVQPGQMFSLAGREPAVWFRPKRPWVVRCEIDQQFITRVKEGMACEIFDDRTEQWIARGAVERRAEWVAPRRSIISDDAALRRDTRTVECVVGLQEEPTELRTGQRVRVQINTGPAEASTESGGHVKKPPVPR